MLSPHSLASRDVVGPEVLLSHALMDRLLERLSSVHAAGLKSCGLLVADPADPAFPYHPSDAVFFDPMRNRRNEPGMQATFHAQGSYFRSYDDAGFVAVPAEVLAVDRHPQAV